MMGATNHSGATSTERNRLLATAGVPTLLAGLLLVFSDGWPSWLLAAGYATVFGALIGLGMAMAPFLRR